MRLISYFGATAIIFAASPVFAAQFVPLTDLVPGAVVSSLSDVSNDGSTVIGSYSLDGVTGRAFRWRLGIGIEDLLRPNSEPINGGTVAVSADGTKILGVDSAYGPFLWTENVGTHYLNLFPAGTVYDVFDLSADGSVVVGNVERKRPNALGDYYEAFRWTSASGITILNSIPASLDGHPHAMAISDDGTTVVGTHDFLNPDHTGAAEYAFRWTTGSGTVSLGTPDGTVRSDAFDATADGTMVVGIGYIDGNHANAYRWRASTGFELLGRHPYARDNGTAYGPQDATPDGYFIVGSAYPNDSTRREPFIWDEFFKFRNLRSILNSATGTPLQGWDDLGVAYAISANGSVVAGGGMPNGAAQDQAWVMLFNRSEIDPRPFGDFNFDGTVDTRDYLVWRDHVGNVVPACTGGDSNCNGFVEWVDYGPWPANYGRTYGSGIGSAASIPEPGCHMLILIAATSVFRRSSRALSHRVD